MHRFKIVSKQVKSCRKWEGKQPFQVNMVTEGKIMDRRHTNRENIEKQQARRRNAIKTVPNIYIATDNTQPIFMKHGEIHFSSYPC